MHPLPPSIMYLAMAGFIPTFVGENGMQYGMPIWRCSLHEPGAACQFVIHKSGDFTHQPPSIEQVWEILHLTASQVQPTAPVLGLQPIASVL